MHIIFAIKHHYSVLLWIGTFLVAAPSTWAFVQAFVVPPTNYRSTSTFPAAAAAAASSPTTTSLSAALTESQLWAIRFSSAAFSYVGFLAYADRPRGNLLVDPDVDIATGPSTVPGAGLGLFAKRTLPAGTVLGTYPGVVIPLTQNLDKLRECPQCEGYTWRFSDNQFVIDPTNPQGDIDDYCRGGNPSMPLSTTLFQTLLGGIFQSPTTLCRINEPPKGRDVNVVTDENLETRTVTFSVEREVYAGEEFFIDYGLSYDRSQYGG